MDNGMLFAGYRNLGTVEIADQINVTRWASSIPYEISFFRAHLNGILIFHAYLIQLCIISGSFDRVQLLERDLIFQPVLLLLLDTEIELFWNGVELQ